MTKLFILLYLDNFYSYLAKSITACESLWGSMGNIAIIKICLNSNMPSLYVIKLWMIK